MSKGTLVSLFPLIVMLSHGNKGDDSSVRGNFTLPTEDDLEWVPHKFEFTLEISVELEKKRIKRSILSNTVFLNPVYRKTFRAGVTKWKKCEKNVNEIANQGLCGICYAVAGASVISNRWCIALEDGLFKDTAERQRYDFNDQISAFHVAACHDFAELPEPTDKQRCEGRSDQLHIFRHAVFTGYVTGGLYNSNAGCLPYPYEKTEPVDNIALTCPGKTGQPKPTCEGQTGKNYHQDFRQTDSYWYAAVDPSVTDIVDRMKQEISTYGPIIALVHFPRGMLEKKKLVVHNDEVAKAAEGKEAGHSVRIIGWDVCRDGDVALKEEKICWLVANSWGDQFHHNGILMVETGHNLLRIEQHLSAPIVAIQGTACEAGDFQTKAIDTAAWISDDGLYLFQGHCTQRLKFTDGKKLSLEGSPEFIQRVFVGAPPGVVYTIYASVQTTATTVDYLPFILDERGDGVSIHRRGTGANATPVKYLCHYRQIKQLEILAGMEKAARFVEGGQVLEFTVSDFYKTPELKPASFVAVHAMLYVGQDCVAIFGQGQLDKGFIGGVFCGLIRGKKRDWAVGHSPQSLSDLLKLDVDDAAGRPSKKLHEDDGKN